MVNTIERLNGILLALCPTFSMSTGHGLFEYEININNKNIQVCNMLLTDNDIETYDFEIKVNEKLVYITQDKNKFIEQL